jgi:hypothetical protein
VESDRAIDDRKNNALALLAANGVSADFSCAASSALTLFAAKTLFREHLYFLTINNRPADLVRRPRARTDCPDKGHIRAAKESN